MDKGNGRVWHRRDSRATPHSDAVVSATHTKTDRALVDYLERAEAPRRRP